MAKREWIDWAFFWLQLLAIAAALGMATGIAYLAGWI